MRKPQGRALRLLGMGAFTAALAFALGTTVGVLVARPPTPEALKPGQAPTSAPVSQREFADERSVTLTISATGERALRSPAQGRLTSLGISAGTPVDSGQVVCAIDGRPIAALATSTPGSLPRRSRPPACLPTWGTLWTPRPASWNWPTRGRRRASPSPRTPSPGRA